MKRILTVIMTLLIVLSLFVSCDNGNSSTNNSNTTQNSNNTSGNAEKPQDTGTEDFIGEIKIGVLNADLTSLFGQMMRDGIQMAMDEYNERGGINGYKLVAVVEDTQSNPDVALNACQKLLGANEVAAIIGPHHSSNVFAIEGSIANADIPFIIGGTNPGIPALNNPNIFGCRTNDTICAKAAAAFIADYPGVTKVAVLTLSDDFGEGGKQIATAYFDENGIDYVAESHNVGDTDMSATIMKVKNAGCDGVFIWTLGEFDILIKQLYELDYVVPTVSNPGLVNTQTMENSDPAWLAGRFCTADFVVNSPEPITADFVKKFHDLYGLMVDNGGACYYSGAVVLFEAMLRCNDPTDRAEIKEQLLLTKDIETPVGVYNARPDINQQLIWGINIITLTEDLEVEFIDYVQA